MRPTADSALTLLPAQLLPPHRSGSPRARRLLPLRGSASPCACRAGGSCCWPAARTWGAQGKGCNLPCKAPAICSSAQADLIKCRVRGHRQIAAVQIHFPRITAPGSGHTECHPTACCHHADLQAAARVLCRPRAVHSKVSCIAELWQG